MARGKTRRSQKAAELLILSAREEFLAHGYARASVRRICERAGKSTGSLYCLFDGKEDLFTACVEPAARALLVAFGAPDLPGGRMAEPLLPPEREVRLRIGLIAEAVESHRASVRLILRELDRPASSRTFARLADTADERLPQLLSCLDTTSIPEGALASQVTHWLTLKWSYQLVSALCSAHVRGGAHQLVPELTHAAQIRLDSLIALRRGC